MSKSTCRFCETSLSHTFVDLGMSPLSNSYVKQDDLNKLEPFFPLHTYVCHNCFLVQLEEFESPKTIFHQYAYFSSFSTSWLNHAKNYVEQVTEKLSLSKESHVVEVACNDGYLLQYFKELNIPVLGIEPAANVAQKTIEKGINTIVDFFGEKLASKISASKKADLIIANNVLAHVPDLHDFVKGLKVLLQDKGTITIEFPHLLNLMAENQFDTIYHEHFSYFSLMTVLKVFAEHGLTITSVEELSTHGGSIRIFAKHTGSDVQPDESVSHVLQKEKLYGLHDISGYINFAHKVKQTKCDVLQFFIHAQSEGKTVAGYGAPAKGNTLINYCGIGKELLPFTVDRNEYKQGLYLPGSRIPIKSPEAIRETKPDYVFILPWNLKDEISNQLSFIREWDGKFVVPIPAIEVF